MEHCPVCTNEVPKYWRDRLNGDLVECRVCGTYRLMEQAAQRLLEQRLIVNHIWKPNLRLSAALRERAERGEVPILDDPVKLIEAYKPASDLLEVIDRILVYIGKKAPGGYEFVPLIGHRDYGIAGAKDFEAFDHALGQAEKLDYIKRKARNEAAYRLEPAGIKRLRDLKIQATGITKVFLSHAAADKQIANFVHDRLIESNNQLEVFVASRPGNIGADEDWLPVIQRKLREADAYCVLLTPQSNKRPWVWFETGAAWMSEKSWIIARAAGLLAEQVPLPISIRQTYSLDDPEGASEVFRGLNAELSDADQFSNRIRDLAGL